jgi:prepilin-type N-terminal cleavage/methylation domain-containing protein
MFKELLKRTDAGLTLVELLVTVVVLGILSAIVSISVGSTLHNAQVKTCQADWNTVFVASNSWVSDQTISGLTTPSSYPSITDLTTNGYMVSLESTDRSYAISLDWRSYPNPVISVFKDNTYTTKYVTSGDTNRAADCKAIP